MEEMILKSLVELRQLVQTREDSTKQIEEACASLGLKFDPRKNEVKGSISVTEILVQSVNDDPLSDLKRFIQTREDSTKRIEEACASLGLKFDPRKNEVRGSVSVTAIMTQPCPLGLLERRILTKGNHTSNSHTDSSGDVDLSIFDKEASEAWLLENFDTNINLVNSHKITKIKARWVEELLRRAYPASLKVKSIAAHMQLVGLIIPGQGTSANVVALFYGRHVCKVSAGHYRYSEREIYMPNFAGTVDPVEEPC